MCYIILLCIFLIIIIQKATLCDSVQLKETACFENSMCIYSSKILNCSNINISLIQLTCNNLKILNVLYLNNNQITYIENNTFNGLLNLYRLSLDNNEIEIIQEDVFKPLTNIKYLHLSKNRIRHIEKNAFKYLIVLRFIDLEYNQLTTIVPELFAKCNHLKNVYLAKNKIKEIKEDCFKENSQIQLLYLSENEISNLTFLKYLSKLVYLDLSYNYIETIHPTTMLQMKDLKKLNLSNNKLESINSGTFSGLGSLETLVLSDNKLTDMGEGCFDHLRKLSRLDLRNNSLELFSYGANFEKYNNFTLQIFIDKNSWRCNYIHEIQQLQRIKLTYYHVDKNISNVNGIPCSDKIKFSKQSTFITKIKSTDLLTTLPTVAITKRIANFVYVTKILDFKKHITTKAPPINSKMETGEEEVTLPEIKIHLSVLIMASLGVVILVTVIIALPIIVTNHYSVFCPTNNNGSELSKECFENQHISRKSNFYVSLDSYNTYYEEIDYSETENYYEEIV